jgi:FlaA1/EpsC-like NDP-sugar epimerase
MRRPPVELDFAPVRNMINSATVLVVGGGGSIGQELCYQIAAFHPDSLLVLDNNEFNLYNAEASIQEKYPNQKLIPIVADAANEQIMRRVIGKYRPKLIFHAAAYKHVPLMETNPYSAVQNNIQCTLSLAKTAIEFGVARFILISTDKAVQPTSVMGATKRICEVIARTYHLENITDFLIVRFGNVLGSSGSVIPKFKAQIERGGPITVTHPEITRYFMLISEAVELVLQAGAIGESGNIYVLDMGEPIRILDLAKYMIELSGLKENEDIKIVFAGLRPGEKLHEDLYFEGEESATRVPNLLVLQPKIIPNRSYIDHVNALLDKLYALNRKELLRELKKLVPEYQPMIVDNGYADEVPLSRERETLHSDEITRISAN